MTTRIAAFLGFGRRAVAAHSRRHEDGITLAIFALALVVLLGMVALGIDGSRIYDERRRAQNAADHAAIAAAYESCTTTAVNVVLAAETAGLASADANGYDDNGVSNEVDINVTGGTGSHQYEAIVETTIPTTFGAVLGFSELDTTARAEAEATGCEATGSGVPAIFGGGDCAGYEKDIDFSGERHIINGLLHTNGDFYQGGSNNTYTNPSGPAVTHVGAFFGKEENNNDYIEEEEPSGILGWPGGYDPAVMVPDAWWNLWRDSPDRRNTTSNTQTTINIGATGGIYYTQASAGNTVTINSIHASATHFTVISKFAPVQMPNMHSGTYHAWANNPATTPENLIVVSGYNPPAHEKCAKNAFMRNGNWGTWNGIFWGPRANVEWSGNNGTINGGLIGHAIKVNGNDHTFNGGTGLSQQSPFVTLQQ